MEYRPLGRTGVSVSQMCLGAMMFGSFGNPMEHLDSYLAADGIDLSADVLDRIDEIVRPGGTVNIADNMWDIAAPALTAASRRR